MKLILKPFGEDILLNGELVKAGEAKTIVMTEMVLDLKIELPMPEEEVEEVIEPKKEDKKEEPKTDAKKEDKSFLDKLVGK